MQTFIVARIDDGKLLYFEAPMELIKTNLPQKPEDLIGYIPSDIEKMKLIVYSGLLTISEAKQKEMYFDYLKNKIIDKDNCEYEVEVIEA